MMIKSLLQLFSPQNPVIAEPAPPPPVHKLNPASDNSGGDQKMDRLELSAEARAAYAREEAATVKTANAAEAANAQKTADPKEQHAGGKSGVKSAATAKSSAPSQLTDGEKMLVSRLQTRDSHVRNHEAQHIAAAGGYVKGGPQYDTQTGPDGRQYAIGGSVSLDVSPVPDNPAATIAKAEVIAHAALAPADPSGADHAVASAASQMEASARVELDQKNREKQAAAASSQTGTMDQIGNQSPALNSKESGGPADSSQPPRNTPPGKHLDLLA